MPVSPSTLSGSASNASNLATVAQIKTQLGISGTAEDTKLAQMLDQAEAIIQSATGQDFVAQNYTEYYEGTGTETLILRHRPVNSIASIYEDDGGYFGASANPFPSSSLLTAGSDYVLRIDNGSSVSTSGIVYRINSAWPKRSVSHPGFLAPVPSRGLGNIKVTYNAGFATIPADIEFATISLVSLMRQAAQFGQPVTSMSLDYFSVTFAGQSDQYNTLTGVNRVLGKYREVVF